MKTLYQILASGLLLFNGIGAIYGGGNLILHPDGNSMQLSLGLLRYSPFNSFLVPGIVLFIANGLFSMFVFVSLLLQWRTYPMLVAAQGLVLACWIIIQVILIQTVYPLHIILAGTGLALIILGVLLQRSICGQAWRKIPGKPNS